MSFHSGHEGKMKLGTSGGTDLVAGVTSWSADISGEKLETTSQQDTPSRARTYIPGLVGADFSADLIFDATNTNGQIALMNAILQGTMPTVNLYPDPDHYFTGTVVITGYSPTAPVDDKATCSVKGTFSGDVTLQSVGG